MTEPGVKIIIVGEPATGKTVLTLLLREFFEKRGFLDVKVDDLDLNMMSREEGEHHLPEREAAIKDRPVLLQTAMVKRAISAREHPETDEEYRQRLFQCPNMSAYWIQEISEAKGHQLDLIGRIYFCCPRD